MSEPDATGADRASPAVPSGRARGRIRVVAVGLFVVAAVLGAWGDWVLWPVYSGIMITIGASALLFAAVVLRVIPFRRSHQLAVLVGAIAIGVLAGQNLGPSRPALTATEGTISVVLTSPRAVTGTAPATCTMDTPATQLSLSGDPNLRLDILPADPSASVDVDQRAFVGMTVSIGDRWIDGPEPRSDQVLLSTMVTGVSGKSAETRMATGSSSDVDVHWDARGGTLAFSRLIPDRRYVEATGDPIDLAGTITWTCPG